MVDTMQWFFPHPSGNVEGENWNAGSYMPRHTKHSGSHYAIDIYGNRGDPVVAPITGTVQDAGHGDTAGYYVKILGSDGVLYYFAHLDGVPMVSQGDQVTGGGQIGTVGNSGNARGTSPHTHFSMKRDGTPIHPAEWLRGGHIGASIEDPQFELEAAAPAEPFRGYTSRNLVGYLGFDITGQTADEWLQGQMPVNIFNRQMSMQEQEQEQAEPVETAETVDLTNPQAEMDMERFMAGIRYAESGTYDGVYTGNANPKSGAYGAYQFLERYWNDFTKLATSYWANKPERVDWSWGAIDTPTVQDQVARGVYEHYLSQYEGNWNLVAVAWHCGPGCANDVFKEAGAEATPQQIDEVLTRTRGSKHGNESSYIDKVWGRKQHG